MKKITAIIASIAIILLQIDGVYSEILPHNTEVTKAPDIITHQRTNIPIINIVAPDASGMSHNRYDRFDVESQGALINNATEKTKSQILNEEVEANKNFLKENKSARLILNEVMSARPSSILGSLEVVGHRADLVIANPYGIVVNGGNFINVSKLSLVTGTPNIEEEKLKRFTMGLGTLSIEERGLKALDSDLYLIGKRANIAGEVEAGEINVKTGNKEYNYETGEITSVLEGTQGQAGGSEDGDTEDTGAQELKQKYPGVDISQSMYADKITIVTTEDGCGVNMRSAPHLVYDLEGIEINSQGDLVDREGKIIAKGIVKIESAGEVNNEGMKIETTGEEGDITITAKDKVSNSGEITSKSNIEIDSQGEIENTNKIEASTEGKDITIKTIRNIVNAGDIQSQGGINLQSQWGLKNETGNKIKAKGDVEIETDGELINKGEITSSSNIDIYSEMALKNEDKIEATGTGEIKIKTKDDVINSGEITSETNIEINSKGIENKSATILAKGDINLTARRINNITETPKEKPKELIITGNKPSGKTSQEVLVSYEKGTGIQEQAQSRIIGKDISIKTEELVNKSGIIEAIDNLEIETRNLTNTRDIITQTLAYNYDRYRKFLWFDTEKVSYTHQKTYSFLSPQENTIKANNIKIEAEGMVTNINQGKIEAGNKLEIEAKEIKNQAKKETGDLSDKLIIETIRDNSGIGRGCYRTDSQEVAKVIYNPLPSKIVGKEIYIKAQEILNESSIIQAQEKLSIEATNLTNKAYMFDYGLQYRYTTKGSEDDHWEYYKGYYTEYYHDHYSATYPYTYSSLTVGKIIGEDIDIKLMGKFSQDEFLDGGFLVRHPDITGKTNISVVEGKKITIQAQEAINSGKLKAQEGLNIETEGKFYNKNGILLGEAIDIDTGKDFVSSILTRQREAGNGRNFIKIDTDVDTTGYINAGLGGLKIDAKGELSLYALDIYSGGDTYLKAGEGLNLLGLKSINRWEVHSHQDNNCSPAEEQEKVLTARLFVYGNLELESIANKKDIDYKAYNIMSSNDVKMISGGDINIENEVEYGREEHWTKKEDSEQRYINEQYRNIKSSIIAGGDIILSAAGTINIVASDLRAPDGQISLTGTEVEIAAALDKIYELYMESKEENFGLDKSSKKEEKLKTTAVSSEIFAKGITINTSSTLYDENGNMIGGNIKITGSNLTAGKDGILLNSANAIYINPIVEQVIEAKSSSSKNEFTGGVKDSFYNEKGKNEVSNIVSDGKITLVSGGNIESVGTNFIAKDDIIMKAGFTINEKGELVKAKNLDGTDRQSNINLYSATDYEIKQTKHEEVGGLFDMIDISNMRMNISGGGISLSTSYKESKDKESITSQKAVSNVIQSGNNIILETSKDLISQASQIVSDGNIDITTGNNLILTFAEEIVSRTKEHSETTITVGVKVGNAYVDVGLAAKNLVDSTQNLNKAKDEYNEMQKKYDRGEISKTALEDAKVNLEIATLNVSNATIALATSISGAATSTETLGFYGAGFTNYDTTTTTSKDKTVTQNFGLISSNKDIRLKSGTNLIQEATDIVAKETLSYDVGKELSILAGKSTNEQESKREHKTAGISYGNNAVQVSGSYGQDSSSAKTTSYTNSQSIAKDIIIKAENTNISGANIQATNNLEVDIKNNLLLESKQDNYYLKGNGYNIGGSIGIGLKGGSNSGGANYGNNKSNSDVNWVNQQTSLTGANSVNILVGNKTDIKGAVIANAEVGYDSDGKIAFSNDKGNLNFITKELEYSDIKDKDVSESNGFNIGLNIGAGTDKQTATKYPRGSISIGATASGQEKEQTTKATIGNGQIIVDGKNIDDIINLENYSLINFADSSSSALPADSSSSVIPAEQLGGNLSEINTTQSLLGLNRDISITQELTKNETTRALNIDTTIDLRLLSKEGRKEIWNDIKNIDKNSAKALTGAVGTVISTGKTIYDVTTKGEIGITDAIDEWKANQKELVNQNNYDRKTINELSKGKTVEEITEATNEKAKLYYNEKDEAKGFRQKQDTEEQNSYINTAQTDITNTKEFINTLAHENSHIYTENETVSNSVGSYANTMWAIGNILNLTSIDTSGNITPSQWYNNNYTSKILQTNTQIAGMIPKQDRNERVGSDIIAIYRNAKQKYSKEKKEPEIRPTNEYYLNSVEQNISLFADIDLMSVSNTVNGIIAKIVSGTKATEAISEQANINVAESYSNIGNPQGRLADLVFSNSLVESANNDLDNGRYITGTIKGLIATSQTALIFTGLGESVAGIRTVAGTSGYNAVATNATRETKLLSDGAISKYPEASKYQYNAFTNPGPLADISDLDTMRKSPILNFYNGYYNKITTTKDMYIYRVGKSGGLSGNEELINNAYGRWFTYNPTESAIKTRIDFAIKSQWINNEGVLTGVSNLESIYKLYVPEGTNIFVGPTATQSGVYLGGKNSLQIFIGDPKKSGVLPIEEIKIK